MGSDRVRSAHASPHASPHASAEEVRQKVSAALWWVKPSTAPSTAAPSTAAPSAAPPVCSKCGGAGWVRVAVDLETGWRVKTEPCACLSEVMARERWERALAASDITPQLLTLSFEGYDPTPHPSLRAGHDAAMAWATEVPGAALPSNPSRPWLFLYGSPGTGKTHLLASAFNLLLERGRYPLYTLVPALLDHVRDGLDAQDLGRKGEYAARFKAIKEAPILILDDLGAEKRTDWSEEALFKLLDYRYREQLPTAVASNVLPSGPVSLEPRIASRLQDRALAVALLMSGPDYRLSGAQSVHARRNERRKGAR